MTDTEREVEQKYAGRFFYKKVRTIEGDKKTIRIDKIERTLKYKLIRKKLELLVAKKFTGDKKNYYGAWFYSSVDRFVEKPCISIAKELIEMNALWNGGVFAFRLQYALDITKETVGTSSYSRLIDIYKEIERGSFDKVVVENEKRLLFYGLTGNGEI